jgi:predicted P-loop ATPase
MSEKERIARKVKDFFERRYELRFNVMKRGEEFRPRGIDYHPWEPLTDRDINRIGQEQMLDCGAAWPIDIKQYAKSSLVPKYNPVHEFLAGCGSWDQRHDYIGDLARRVPCHYAEWPQLFHRWFLGMVATWLGRSRDHANSVVPMLVGEQGCRKSTFCKLLLPHSLREYYIDDIKLDNAEQVERMLGRMALVNIDEYNAKTEREQAKIKRVLTERDVQTRRMRSDQYQLLPRMASFIATTNDRQPLTDPTGSRRYICCDIDGIIDTDTPIDHRQLYAQAVAELRSGKPWYLSKQEEQKLEQHNQNFRVEMSPEQVLLAWYTQAERRQENLIRTVDILKELSKHVGKADLPTVQSLTRTLRACGFAYGAVSGQRGWYARRKS